MIVGLKIVHITWEHSTCGIFSNESSYFWYISHFRYSMILTQCVVLKLGVARSTARLSWVIGCGILRIIFLPE
jgi:hypothetical protein